MFLRRQQISCSKEHPMCCPMQIEDILHSDWTGHSYATIFSTRVALNQAHFHPAGICQTSCPVSHPLGISCFRVGRAVTSVQAPSVSSSFPFPRGSQLICALVNLPVISTVFVTANPTDGAVLPTDAAIPTDQPSLLSVLPFLQILD